MSFVEGLQHFVLRLKLASPFACGSLESEVAEVHDHKIVGAQWPVDKSNPKTWVVIHDHPPGKIEPYSPQTHGEIRDWLEPGDTDHIGFIHVHDPQKALFGYCVESP